MQASQWASSSKPAADSSSELMSPSHEEVDQFAQTRQPDDLFDDDFTPIPEPVIQSLPPQASQPKPPQSRHYNDHSTRGRGRCQSTKKNSERPQPNPPPQQSAPLTQPLQPIPFSTTQDPSVTSPSPEKPQKPSTPAARGNRLGTGGIQKPKLTEDELSARLEAAKLNNARREEAHRLAEADEASFQQREARAREKRREEGAARRVMEGEREKNRLRKLGARGGREWDEGKEEEIGGRGGGFRRGVNGGIGQVERGVNGRESFQARGQQGEGDEGGHRGSARGGYSGGGRGRGRGRGGGRGRGRGDYGNGGGVTDAPPGTENRNGTAKFADTDFPALSVTADATMPSKEKISTLENADILKSPAGEKGSWADQVEALAPGVGNSEPGHSGVVW